jgi:peptidoglycan/LPS O-acetylase OafA/YrhL
MTALATDPWRRSMALAGGLVAGGFVAIAVAWVGVSGAPSVPEQVAFAVSGGFGGIALTGAGLALLDVQRRRMEAALERRDFDAFATDLTEIAELIAARRTARHDAPVRRRVVRER